MKDCPGNAACLDFSQITADCAGGGRFKQFFPCKNKKKNSSTESPSSVQQGCTRPFWKGSFWVEANYLCWAWFSCLPSLNDCATAGWNARFSGQHPYSLHSVDRRDGWSWSILEQRAVWSVLSCVDPQEQVALVDFDSQGKGRKGSWSLLPEATCDVNGKGCRTPSNFMWTFGSGMSGSSCCTTSGWNYDAPLTQSNIRKIFSERD